eukprot:gene2633-5535_t
MEENGTAAETVFSSSNESRNIDNDSEADFENDSNSNSKLYIAWLKRACDNVSVATITDFKDGKKLLALAEDLTGLSAGTPETGKSKIHNINNCYRALSLFRRAGVDTSSFQGEEFDSFDRKKINSFLWQLVRQFSNVQAGSPSDFDSDLLAWVQQKASRRLNVSNLRPDTLCDGLVLAAILESYHPENTEYEKLAQASRQDRIRKIFDIMYSIGFPRTSFAAEDFLLAPLTRKDALTFLATLYNSLEMNSKQARRQSRMMDTLERKKTRQRKRLPIPLMEAQTPPTTKTGIDKLLQKLAREDCSTISLSDLTEMLAESLFEDDGIDTQCIIPLLNDKLSLQHSEKDSPLYISLERAAQILTDIVDSNGDITRPPAFIAAIQALQELLKHSQDVVDKYQQKTAELEEELQHQDEVFKRRLQETEMDMQRIAEESEREAKAISSELQASKFRQKDLEDTNIQLLSEIDALRQCQLEDETNKQRITQLQSSLEDVRRELNEQKKNSDSTYAANDELFIDLRNQIQDHLQTIRVQASTIDVLENEKDALLLQVERLEEAEKENVSLREQNRELSFQVSDMRKRRARTLPSTSEATDDDNTTEEMTLGDELKYATSSETPRHLPQPPKEGKVLHLNKALKEVDRLQKVVLKSEQLLKEKEADFTYLRHQLQEEKDVSAHYEAQADLLAKQLHDLEKKYQLAQQLLINQQQSEIVEDIHFNTSSLLTSPDKIITIMNRIDTDPSMSDVEKAGWREAVLALRSLVLRLEDDLELARMPVENLQNVGRAERNRKYEPTEMKEATPLASDQDMNFCKLQVSYISHLYFEEKESEIDNLRNAYEDVKTQLKSYKDLSQVEISVHREVLHHQYNRFLQQYELCKDIHEHEAHVWFRTPEQQQLLPAELYPFTAEEDAIICDIAQKTNENWTSLAFAIPGRLDSELQLRYEFLMGRSRIKQSSQFQPTAHYKIWQESDEVTYSNSSPNNIMSGTDYSEAQCFDDTTFGDNFHFLLKEKLGFK